MGENVRKKSGGGGVDSHCRSTYPILTQSLTMCTVQCWHSDTRYFGHFNRSSYLLTYHGVCLVQDFEQAVLSLKHSGALTMNAANEIIIQKSLNKHTTFYSQMFEPFLLAYWVRASKM